jgi:hypothetical protein
VSTGHYEIVEMLLKHNIDTYLTTYTNGMTALDVARGEEGYEDIVQLIERAMELE